MNQTINLGDTLTRLYDTIESRRGADPESSYTAALLDAGLSRCAKKFGEEAVETALATIGGDKQALREETADVLYHLLVLLALSDVELDEIAAVLVSREGVSGLEVKAARGRDI